jgi:4-carboxymuconolactone decarboxylase
LARLDPLPMEQLTPEQKALHAELGRTRKRVSGPFAIWLRNPPLADAANKVVLALREHGRLEKRLYELIVLVVVRHWSAQYAWAAHEAAAGAAGLSPEAIEAIRHRRKPDLKNEDERVVYDTVSELLERKQALSQASYDRLVKQFGLDLAIEIVTVAGLYSMVATVLNGFDVPTPTGEKPFN